MTESFVGAQQGSSTTSYRGTTANTSGNKQNVTINSNGGGNTSQQRDLSPDRIKKAKTSTGIMTRAFHWSGKDDFLLAQGKIAGILLIAYIGNVWEPSYNRNENHDMFTFWFMNLLILLVGIYTLKHDATASSRGVQLLSRAQTEEWKGWMQWAFIMVRFTFTSSWELFCECAKVQHHIGFYLLCVFFCIVKSHLMFSFHFFFPFTQNINSTIIIVPTVSTT